MQNKSTRFSAKTLTSIEYTMHLTSDKSANSRKSPFDCVSPWKNETDSANMNYNVL